MQKSTKAIFAVACGCLLLAAVGMLFVGALLKAGILRGPQLFADLSFGAAAVLFLIWIFSLFVFKAETKPKEAAFLRRFLFPELLRGKSEARVIAYIGVTAAFSIVSNLFEFRFADIQFSLTIFTSVLAGMLIGPIFGAAAVFLGDAVGYVVNSWGYLYLPWVGVSCAAMAFLAGIVMKLPFRFKGSGYWKLALVCLLTLAVCSVGINTTGFYFYYTSVGFSSKALSLIEEHFGGGSTYLAYAVVRLLFMGQIWNSLFNYALLFLAFPFLKAAKPLKKQLG